jgi:[ribosomal protein S5]-alanine N-acetyltransferase
MSSNRSHQASDVRLRGISRDDALAITRLLEGDTELALRTATMPIPYTLEDAHTFLSTADPREVFAIVVGDDLVGTIGMIGTDEPVEIGYWIGRIFWGRGYATSAVGQLIEEARRRGISHLVADAFPDNIASMRVLEKSGFIRRGEVERDFPKRGGLRRLIHFELRL